MLKLFHKASTRAKIDKNNFSPHIITALFTLSLVLLLVGFASADEKITKSHGFNFFGELSYQEVSN